MELVYAPRPVADRLRVVVVVGTRPEAIKMFPVIQALRTSGHVQPFVVTTGQHAQMAHDVLAMAGITPDASLVVVRRTGTINELCSQVVTEVGELLAALQKEDAVEGAPYTIATMVHGDTTSAMAAGLASAQAGIPVIHVEAGLRTYNPRGPFPEEMNRQLIARMALVQIAPTAINEANLIREMVSDAHVFVSGNTSIDALMWACAQPVQWSDERLQEVVDSGAPIVVATLHRRENWPYLADIASALNRITRARPDVRVVLPMHPNPEVRQTLIEVLGTNPRVLLVDALGYVEFAHLLEAATLAISDSGGIQEEAPSVGTPVLVARQETERQEGVDAGTLALVGVDPSVIAGTALSLLDDPTRLQAMRDAVNPFGDGRAAERIRSLIDYLVVGGSAPQSFGSGVSRRAILTAAGYHPVAVTPVLTEEEWDDELVEHVAGAGHLTF